MFLPAQRQLRVWGDVARHYLPLPLTSALSTLLLQFHSLSLTFPERRGPAELYCHPSVYNALKQSVNFLFLFCIFDPFHFQHTSARDPRPPCARAPCTPVRTAIFCTSFFWVIGKPKAFFPCCVFKSSQDRCIFPHQWVS